MSRGSDGAVAGRRRRAPWLLFAVAAVLFAVTVALVVMNRSYRDPFIYFALAMVVGYTSVGAVVASRRSDNPVGWVMLTIGLTFVASGFTAEYLTRSNTAGGLPFVTAIAWLSNWTWNVVAGALLLLVVLYPTGRVHARGWRFLPRLIVAVTAVLAIGTMLRPGPLELAELDARIPNPTGIDAFAPVAGIAETVSMFALLFSALASVVSLVHRYRRSSDVERQQLRLFVYAVTVAAFIFGAGALAGAVVDVPFLGDLLFAFFFAVLGIGVPSAVGVAMLRYRLLDLDVVVRKTVVYALLAVLLTAVFVFVAGLLGILAGTAGRGAFALVAFAIGVSTAPLWRLARRIADRVVFGGRASPYELLAGFGQRMAEAYSTDDVLPRLATVLGNATGATRAQVWLRVGMELRAAGVWPEGAVRDAPLPMASGDLPEFAAAEHAIEVRHQGELLGALSVRMPASDPMNPSKEKLVRDLAQHAGLVLRNVRLIEELRASRERLVAAQDEERRRIERNIHDGAQQQLVALAVNLKLARTLAARDPAKAEEILDRLREDAQQALEDLRDLARGIYPPLLADKGLAAALEAQARKSATPVEVHSDGVGRFSREAEAAVYFSVLEALQNASKYAAASHIAVRLRHEDGRVVFEVEDDGRGFDPDRTPRGTGLQNMTDRLEALGGSLEISSAPGAGTTVRGVLSTGGGERR